MPTVTIPDYNGGSIVNLAAEVELRLTGSAAMPGLHEGLAAHIPDAETYVMVIFDGLGSSQLDHPRAATLAASAVASIDAPFPTTTTVAMATMATGLPPSQHGLIGYQLWIPEVGEVVNTIKWTTLWGAPVDVATVDLLPKPNLWERLRANGIEAITVQPAQFESTALSTALYRGCRFEGVTALDEQIEATVDLAATPRRLVFTYLASVDFAAHVHGQDTTGYANALGTADLLWSRLAARLPPGVCLVGTADHGHVDFPKARQVRIPKAAHRDRIFYGDGRAMFVRGDGASLAQHLPATWIPFEEAAGWWGPEPRHSAFEARRPDGVLLADDDSLLLHRFSDDRMIGNHGALTDAERRVPLLVRPA